MAKNYSFEKGKFGIITGTIIPFGRYLDGTNPEGDDWVNYVPAGFLRCNGLVYKARDFRALSTVLGTGANSKFRKENITLEELNENFTLGQFQLPDLGSKYISASSANGTYNNLFVTDPRTGNLVQRVGLEVELALNRGNILETTYSGSFNVPTTSVDFPETQNFGTTLSGQIPSAFFNSDNLLSHGHYSNAVVVRSGPFNVNLAVGGGATKSGYDADQELSFTSIGGSPTGTSHNHSLLRNSPTRSTTSNISSFNIPADQIVTTTKINVSNTFKMDDLQHKFILVEYLIKT
jgi:hypothetical protein